MKVLAITGPTGMGKTEIIFKLYEKFNIKIISVDSALVYKELNIGAAKPSAKELLQYPHDLVNVTDLSKVFTCYDFVTQAKQSINAAIENKQVPILVGGTMMYLKALQQGLSDMPKADIAIRAELNRQIENNGLSYLYAKLQTLDPVYASKINANDAQRIIRALEVNTLTGKTMASFNKKTAMDIDIHAMMPETREQLHANIAKRFHLMLEQGLLEEVKGILAKPVDPNISPLKAIGYKYTIMYLQNKLASLQECIDKNIVSTRQLAKRQCTWLKHWDNINLYSNKTKLYEKLCQILKT